jgi:hypothetical protein
MALMILMRLDGQMLPSVGGFVGGWFHVGWGILAIWGDFRSHKVVSLSIEVDGCPEAGDFVCHSVVDFMTIEADGCPKNGDLVCHLVVGLSIKNHGCPEAGDFPCHSGVDLLTIEADGCPRAGDFVCHLAVDFGRHWGVGFLAIRVDGCPGAGDFVLLRASDSSGNLGSASGIPLRPGWSNNALRTIKPGVPCFAPCRWTHWEIWAAPTAYPCTPDGQTTPCSQQVLGGLRF